MRSPRGRGGRLSFGRAPLLLGALLTPSSALLVDEDTVEIDQLLQRYEFGENLSSSSEVENLDQALLRKAKCKGTIPSASDEPERRMWSLANKIMQIIKKYPGGGGGGGGGGGDSVDGDDKLKLYQYGEELAEILGNGLPIFFSGLEYFFTKQTANDGARNFWKNIEKSGKALGQLSRLNGHMPGEKQFFMNFLLGYIAGDHDRNKNKAFNPTAYADEGEPLHYDFELGYMIGYYRPDASSTSVVEPIKLVVTKSNIDPGVKEDLALKQPKTACKKKSGDMHGTHCGLNDGLPGINDKTVPSPQKKWKNVIPLWLIFFALDMKPVKRTTEDTHMPLFGADVLGKLMGKHHNGPLFDGSDGKPYQYFFGGLGKGLDTVIDDDGNPKHTHWPKPFSNEPYYWLGFHLGLGTSVMLTRKTDNLDGQSGRSTNIFDHQGDDNVYHLYAQSGFNREKGELGVKHHEFRDKLIQVHTITNGVEVNCFMIQNGKEMGDCKGKHKK